MQGCDESKVLLLFWLAFLSPSQSGQLAPCGSGQPEIAGLSGVSAAVCRDVKRQLERSETAWLLREFQASCCVWRPRLPPRLPPRHPHQQSLQESFVERGGRRLYKVGFGQYSLTTPPPSSFTSTIALILPRFDNLDVFSEKNNTSASRTAVLRRFYSHPFQKSV